MKKQLLFFILSLLCFTGLKATGHYPTLSIGYHDEVHNHAYTVDPNGRQSSLHLNTAQSDIPGDAEADIYALFTFDTSGKNVYIVYTTDGSTPTKSHGTSISASFSKYNDPDRWWVASIPATNTEAVTVKYVIYISDSDLASGYGRIGVNGYVTSWTEGDDAGFSYTTQALPVEMVSFTGKEVRGENLLSWQTATEINNEVFEIEHSEDSRLWKKIGTVKGNGTSLTAQSYDFIHSNPAAGLNYYRLRQVDYDGMYEFSEIIAVINRQKEIAVKVYPNPALEKLVVQGDKDMTGMKLVITNMAGQVVIEKTLGSHRMELPVASLRNGTYVYQIINAQGLIEISRIFEKI